MNYERIYNELIKARRSAPVPEGYTETHHIIPKSLGGNNDADNLIALTPEDHFMAHRLLAKIHGGPMSQALWFMCQGNTRSAKNVYISSRVHTKARENAAKAKSGENHPFYGRHHSAEAIVKIREARRGKTLSSETRQKLREALCGEKHPNWGKPRAAQTRTKISETHRNKQQYIFQHPEHGERICTQYELWQAYGLDQGHLSKLVHGKYHIHKGWRCLGPAE